MARNRKKKIMMLSMVGMFNFQRKWTDALDSIVMWQIDSLIWVKVYLVPSFKFQVSRNIVPLFFSMTDNYSQIYYNLLY